MPASSQGKLSLRFKTQGLLLLALQDLAEFKILYYKF